MAALIVSEKTRHYSRLAERANNMYELLCKIAFDKEKWTVREVRDLLSKISAKAVKKMEIADD